MNAFAMTAPGHLAPGIACGIGISVVGYNRSWHSLFRIVETSVTRKADTGSLGPAGKDARDGQISRYNQSHQQLQDVP
jgi:hypothetical protein